MYWLRTSKAGGGLRTNKISGPGGLAKGEPMVPSKSCLLAEGVCCSPRTRSCSLRKRGVAPESQSGQMKSDRQDRC